MKKNGEFYGSHKVISPKGLLPQAADVIDNTTEIWDNEILLDVIALQPTATAFHSLKNKFGEDIEGIKGEIIRIVEEKKDRKSTRLNSSHARISYAVFCLKKKIRYRMPSSA